MVVDDAGEAARLAAEGRDVVLVVREGEPVAASEGGPGRIALFVGAPEDPAVRAAAGSMAEELFGPDAPRPGGAPRPEAT